MKCELKVKLPYDTPVVGCEIIPNVYVKLTKPSETLNYSLNFNWYRLQSEEQITCCVHNSEIAAFQCICCSNLELPESYHCSTRCFIDTWPNHRERHLEAAVNKASSGKDQTSGVVDRGVKSWCKVGSSKTYVPSMDDLGYILRLESVAVDCNEGNLLATEHVIETDRVIVAPVPCPRCMIHVGPLEGSGNFNLEALPSVAGTFSVLSYNVLSDLYATRERYSYCPTWALTWEYRRQNLLREIIGYEADILCLQEVQSDHFENFFEPELVQRGYSVIYKRKSIELFTGNGYAIDGCATFFRHNRFKFIRKFELEFDKCAHSVVESLQPGQKTKSDIRLRKGNVAVAVILEPMENGAVSDTLDCRICVVNTHISANPMLTDVKLWQVATLINGLEMIADSCIPVLICGDLNSLPGSAVYDLLVMGKVDPNHEELAVDPVGILQHLKLSHKLPLVSAYSSLLRTKEQWKNLNPKTYEPWFTNFTQTFAGTIDYIFYTADRLTVKGLLELPKLESVTKETALPSPEWSSDHIALMANFSLKPVPHPVPSLPSCPRV